MSVPIETPIHFKRANAGKKIVAVGPAPEQAPAPPARFPGLTERLIRQLSVALIWHRKDYSVDQLRDLQ